MHSRHHGWVRRANIGFTRFSGARASLKYILAFLAVLAPVGILTMQPSGRATANIITVNTLTDESTAGDGLCSLREAINNANAKSDTTSGDCVAGTGTDTINFSVSGTITLGSALPMIANSAGGSLSIDGSGHNITIDGANAYQVLSVNSGATLALVRLTIAHGFGNFGGVGNAGILTVTNSTLSSNVAAGNGGGIGNFGALTVANSTLSGNSASLGGGIYNINGTVTVLTSTLSANTATMPAGAGGGIFSSSGTVTITNSTFARNSATSTGGLFNGASGLYNNGAVVTITNTTFSGNTGPAGGIYTDAGGKTTLVNSIFAASANGNCVASGGSFVNGGYNIADDATCGFGTTTGANGQNIGDNVNPLLSAAGLQNNGGPTQTIALQFNSPAIDAIPVANCPSTDQRGMPRPDGEDALDGAAACDIGAFESPLTTATITVNTLSDESTPGDGLCSLREAINNANSASDTTSGDCAAGAPNTIINFSLSGPITLGSTLPAIANSFDGSLTIDGTGHTITVDGAHSFQVMTVSSGANLTVNKLTISNARTAAIFGGGIDNSGTLTVTNSTFAGNAATGGIGGGIGNEFGATATVANSAFDGNSASQLGGGIGNAGTLTVTNSTFNANTSFEGGGIGNEHGQTATVTDDTFAGNSASSLGGGIGNEGTLSVTNSTFEDNTAPPGFGGGIGNTVGAATVENSTFHDNGASTSEGGAIANGGTTGGGANVFLAGTVTVTNSVLAASTGGNCGGPIANGGYNISDDASCGFGTSAGANGKTIGDNVNPLLDPDGLQNNGGPTETIALQSRSAAVGAIPAANCTVASDQRGEPRPGPGQTACDIGAYEGSEELSINPSKLTFGSVSVGTTSAPQTVTITNEFGEDTVDLFASFITANFVQTGSNCSTMLGPLQSCQVSFACKPKTTGALIGAYAFLYGSWEASALDWDDFRKIGVVQFTCTGS